MRSPIKILMILLPCLSLLACGRKAGDARLIDVSDAVVDHQQIEPYQLQQHHVAYNASIAQVEKDFVMAFRIDAAATDPNGEHTGGLSQHLAVMGLDANFEPTGPYQILPTPHEPGCSPSAEDPRLISVNGTAYVIYNAAVYTGPRPGRRMYVARLKMPTEQGESFGLDAAKEILLAHPGRGRRVEKNWTPFVYRDHLHLIYETNPPSVYRLDESTLDDSGAWAVAHFVSQSTETVDFSFGSMRGGTPAVFDAELNQYISFFHSAQDANFGIGRQRYYFMGAYTFDKEPPFAIRSLTQDPILIPEPNDAPVGSSRIVYPQGLVDDGNNFVVSYGRNDNSIFLLTFDKRGIYARLKPAR